MAEPLAALMIGPELRVEAAMALPWLALAALFSGFALSYWSEAFAPTHRPLRRALLMLAPAAAQLALTFLLARTLGAMGAAIAAAAGALVACAALAIGGRRWLALPAPSATLARTLAATALMAAGLSLLAAPRDALSLTLYVATAAALYAAGAVVFGVLDARQRALAFARIGLARLRGDEAIGSRQ
jgi:O-antigen/teichoic acid export membrane protein